MLAGDGAAMRDRLMYGSDWSMLLQHDGSEKYLSAVSSIFAEAEHNQLLAGRALDFLGLGIVPSENGLRIRARIESYGANPDTWLAQNVPTSRN